MVIEDLQHILQGAYNSGKPGKLREFVNSGKLRENSGILSLLREFIRCLLFFCDTI